MSFAVTSVSNVSSGAGDYYPSGFGPYQYPYTTIPNIFGPYGPVGPIGPIGPVGPPGIGGEYTPPSTQWSLSIPYSIDPALLEVLKQLVAELQARRLADEARAQGPILPIPETESPQAKRKIELDD